MPLSFTYDKMDWGNIMDRIQISAVCGVGLKRKNNEDNLCLDRCYLDEAQVDKTSVTPFEYCGEQQIPFHVAVCDGMGGEDAGELASLTVARELSLLPPSPSDADVEMCFERINTILNKEAMLRDARCIGSAVAMLCLSETSVTACNIGDSRIYKIRGGQMSMLSHDHTEVQLYVDNGLLSVDAARKHPMRHALNQYLGMPDALFSGSFRTETDMKPGDAFLVCSDGLTECVDDCTILSILENGGNAPELYNEAMKNGGNDNTTAIVLRVK